MYEVEKIDENGTWRVIERLAGERFLIAADPYRTFISMQEAQAFIGTLLLGEHPTFV